MPLESQIESDSVAEIRKMFGIEAVKVGHDGWPDRVVPYAPHRVVWLEFKQPSQVDKNGMPKGSGKTFQRQRIRRKDLAAMGHEVFYPTSKREAVAIVARMRRKVGL